MSRLGPGAATASKEMEKQAARYDHLQQDLANALDRASIIHGLQKDAAKLLDSPDRRVARRVIGGVFVGAMETNRELMAQHQNAAAARACENDPRSNSEIAAATFFLQATTHK